MILEFGFFSWNNSLLRVYDAHTNADPRLSQAWQTK